ncbi:hypothetical protein FHS29_005888 [Saccharothrix tamanrassetensis]|uniref:DUF3152 domain-containing protein n=1 Tax=Saccharothrix tamanrassetensis TaxID=1051531 RepID=A0A841CSZ4_9PSEU|nr:DUF3152 domain-containing protein [Saccharothrix tamanrassetensis]MBB5959268.1 hypothetical protein [Saccharothrix tamanrassetensis]
MRHPARRRPPSGGARTRLPHYLVGICLAAATVMALDARMASWEVVAHGRTPADAGAATRPADPPEPPPGLRRSSAELPPGEPFPQRGTGTWRTVPGTTRTVGTGTVRTYAVEVEAGVALPQGDDAFAARVGHALAHPRGWTSGGRFAFRRVDREEPDFRVRLAAQETARALCGFELPYDTSCRVGATVYVSAARWFRGAYAFGDDLRGYQAYAVNHEVGHFLGFGHEPCPEDGGPAPVMMQQTLSTGNDELATIIAGSDQGIAVAPDGKWCTPNPWPDPPR